MNRIKFEDEGQQTEISWNDLNKEEKLGILNELNN